MKTLKQEANRKWSRNDPGVIIQCAFKQAFNSASVIIVYTEETMLPMNGYKGGSHQRIMNLSNKSKGIGSVKVQYLKIFHLHALGRILDLMEELTTKEHRKKM